MQACALAERKSNRVNETLVLCTIFYHQTRSFCWHQIRQPQQI